MTSIWTLHHHLRMLTMLKRHQTLRYAIPAPHTTCFNTATFTDHLWQWTDIARNNKRICAAQQINNTLKCPHCAWSDQQPHFHFGNTLRLHLGH
jgi:hypothetical protein